MSQRAKFASGMAGVVALTLALGACGTGAPIPTAPRTPTIEPAQGEARAVVRLSGREVELLGGNCTWSEADGQLVVSVGPTGSTDSLRLTAPLSWVGEDLPPGAGSGEAALLLRVGGQEMAIPAGGLTGTLASDLGTGTFDAGLVAGMPLNGEFDCPTVIDLD